MASRRTTTRAIANRPRQLLKDRTLGSIHQKPQEAIITLLDKLGNSDLAIQCSAGDVSRYHSNSSNALWLAVWAAGGNLLSFRHHRGNQQVRHLGRHLHIQEMCKQKLELGSGGENNRTRGIGL